MSISAGAFGIIQMIGSVFAKRGEDGKVEIAAAPWVVLYVAGSLLGCYSQSGEPFSTCARNMMSILGG